MLHSLYGGNAPWPLTARFEDPTRPGVFDPSGGADRLVDYDDFHRGWDNSIPTEDKTQWRDPAVAEAYARTAVELDPTSQTRTPPSARIPTAAYRKESFNLAQGHWYWEAGEIYTPTLAVRVFGPAQKIYRRWRQNWSMPQACRCLPFQMPPTTSLTISPSEGRPNLFKPCWSF